MCGWHLERGQMQNVCCFVFVWLPGVGQNLIYAPYMTRYTIHGDFPAKNTVDLVYYTGGIWLYTIHGDFSAKITIYACTVYVNMALANRNYTRWMFFRPIFRPSLQLFCIGPPPETLVYSRTAIQSSVSKINSVFSIPLFALSFQSLCLLCLLNPFVCSVLSIPLFALSSRSLCLLCLLNPWGHL